MASRIAAVLPITEETVRLYQPLILPLAISALGLLGILQSRLRNVVVLRSRAK